MTAKVFGGKIGSTAYTFLFFAFAISSVITFVLTKESGEGKISRDLLFYIFGGSCVVALLFALFFKETLFVSSKAYRKTKKDVSNYDMLE